MKKKKKKNDKWNIILHPKWPINLAGVFVLTRIRSRVNRNPFIEENSSAIDPRERERERESTIAWTLTAPYGRCTTFNPPLMKEAIRVHVANVAQHVPRSTRAYIVCIHVCVCVCVSCTRIGSFTNAELLKASALLSPGRHDNEYFHS